MRVYEGMFVLDSGKSGDWNAAAAQVHGILTRYGATILDSRKWDERRLAYEIKGRKRGVYILVYFDAPRPNITSIRHDLELSETVLRYLIVVREKYTPPEAAEPVPAKAATTDAEPAVVPVEEAPPEAAEPVPAKAVTTDAEPAVAPVEEAPPASPVEPTAEVVTEPAAEPAVAEATPPADTDTRAPEAPTTAEGRSPEA